MSSMYGNPYSVSMFPREKSLLYSEFGRTGYRRTLVNYPWGVDAGAGNIVVAERDNHRLQLFDAHGCDTNFNPHGTCGHGENQFYYPCGVTTSGLQGANIIVADTGNRRIVYCKPTQDKHGYGGLQQTYTFGHQYFSEPTGVTVDMRRQYIFVSDIGRNQVTMHREDGYCVGELQPYPDMPFNRPSDIVLDESGRIFVADSDNHCVQVFEKNGDFIGRIGGFGRGAGQFDKPWGLCIDRAGNILVSDEGNGRVQCFSRDCRFIQIVAEDLHVPKGVSINIHENLVVATHDPYNFLKILKYK